MTGAGGSGEAAAQAGAAQKFGWRCCLEAVMSFFLLAYVLRVGMKHMAALGRIAKPLLGGTLLFAGSLVLTGWDKDLESRLAARLPEGWIDLLTRF